MAAEETEWVCQPVGDAPGPRAAGSAVPILQPAGGGKDEAVVSVYRGVAIQSESADTAADAAADALGKLEVDRAMGSYGSFDSSSGLVVATAGRSGAALAALLASAARGTLRKIVVANCCAGGKMAQALSFGLMEQAEADAAAKAAGGNDGEGGGQHVMSHAGGTTEEHAAWSAAVGGVGGSGGAAPGSGGGGEGSAEAGPEDGTDWAALQAHLNGASEADLMETSAGAAPLPAEPAEVEVLDAAQVLARVTAGEVHVVVIGAESVDPTTGAATVSAGCEEACEMARAACVAAGVTVVVSTPHRHTTPFPGLRFCSRL